MAIPIRFLTAVRKQDAIATSYPGGIVRRFPAKQPVIDGRGLPFGDPEGCRDWCKRP